MIRYQGRLYLKSTFIKAWGHLYENYEIEKIEAMQRGDWMHGHGGVIACEQWRDPTWGIS